MGIVRRQIQFRLTERNEIIEALNGIAKHGQSWATIEPWVDIDQMPVTSVLRRLFSARGPKVPAITWVSGSNELGVRHGAGPKAAQQLRDAQIEFPKNSKVLSDHPRRGLVIELDPSTTVEEIIDFSIEAAAHLAQVSTDDRWVAEISTPE